jgi:hypothetical protein
MRTELLFLKIPAASTLRSSPSGQGDLVDADVMRTHEQYYCMQRKFSKKTRLIEQQFVYR